MSHCGNGSPQFSVDDRKHVRGIAKSKYKSKAVGAIAVPSRTTHSIVKSGAPVMRLRVDSVPRIDTPQFCLRGARYF